MRGLPWAAQGFALAEVLVALLVFSIAIAGGLRAQLGALTATRDTLAQLRAARLLDDLVQRGDAAELSALAPASLPLAAGPSEPAPPRALDDWSLQLQSGLPAARLCLAPRGALLEVALAWQSSRSAEPPGCGNGAPRVAAHVVVP